MKNNESKKMELVKKVGLDQHYKAESWADYNRQMFDTLAHKYDAGNILHAWGSKPLMDRMAIDRMNLPEEGTILDLCTGSGDIAIRIAKKFPKIKIKAIDVSEKMLEIARVKATGLDNIEFISADAMKLPFEDSTFNGAIISYGLRNLLSIEDGLGEIRRVVKSGGVVSNIDQGKPANPFLYAVYKLYFFIIAPFIGKMIFHRGEFNTFRYLPESNEFFPKQDELVKIFEKVGYENVVNYNYIFGAVAQQVGKVTK